MEAPRTLRAFADRPGTGPGIIYRSHPSPARVSRSEANFTKPDDNSRFATFAPGAEGSHVKYVSTVHSDWAKAQVVHPHRAHGAQLDKPAVGGVHRATQLSPQSDSTQCRFGQDPEVKSRPLTVFPAPRLSVKAVTSPTANAGASYFQPPCASMSPKRQPIRTEAFGGLETQAVGMGYVIQAPSASVTKRAAGSPKEAFGGLETQVAGASYLIQAPCASTSSKGKSVESPKEAFGGLETQVAGASYLIQASCASTSSTGKSVESPKEAFGGPEIQVAGASYLIQASCASTSSTGKSVESPKEALGGLETQVAEESPESSKCSTSPQAKSFFRCPECNAFVSSMEEALKHCGTLGDGGEPTSPSCLPSGEAIAFDEQGRMLIVRVTQPTGERETVVRLPDGQQRTFDASSVKKMIESPAEEISKFLENLSNTELRGLVHEVGQRLLEGSRLYHSRLAELDRLGEMSNMKFFDLDEKATVRDLDNAYRKLAKKMHPDKNGGTDEAKQRFQAMKERYEALKKKLSEDNVDKESEGRKNEEPKEREPKEKNEKKDKNEDSNDDAKSIEYDPSNKESMVSTVVKMAGQLKNIDVQMDILLKELSRMSQHPEGT
eukprot:s411_g3.t1